MPRDRSEESMLDATAAQGVLRKTSECHGDVILVHSDLPHAGLDVGPNAA